MTQVRTQCVAVGLQAPEFSLAQLALHSSGHALYYFSVSIHREPPDDAEAALIITAGFVLADIEIYRRPKSSTCLVCRQGDGVSVLSKQASGVFKHGHRRSRQWDLVVACLVSRRGC